MYQYKSFFEKNCNSDELHTYFPVNAPQEDSNVEITTLNPVILEVAQNITGKLIAYDAFTSTAESGREPAFFSKLLKL